jgi:hypothetical protein
MIELAKRLLNQHSRSGVLIDANLLFLLTITTAADFSSNCAPSSPINP